MEKVSCASSSRKFYNIWQESALLNNTNILSNKLAKILDINEEIIKNKLSSNKNFVWLKRNITPDEHQKIIDLGEINLEFHNERKRIYPFKNTASHLVGFVNIDQIGQSGIERYFNKSLSNSKDITLSIDINLQQSITNNFEAIYKKERNSTVRIFRGIKQDKY